jgi:aspartate kinase
MKVFKFGGASVKNAAGVRNITEIIHSFGKNQILVVVSAMGKTTNALEKLVELASVGKSFTSEWNDLLSYHKTIIGELFAHPTKVDEDVQTLFDAMKKELSRKEEFDQVYDQVVCFGELIATKIVWHWLNERYGNAEWIDARKYIATDRTFREGKVDWKKSGDQIRLLRPTLEKKVVITQGFIGQTPDGLTTTLGREGSDFSAAIFAYCLDGESVTIWKDVPGVMNADPKRLAAATVFEELPFREAAEMTYYGASVIHPKTIKPLANKGIPLFVKNFDDPSLPGTRIHECQVDNLPPLIVFKDNQCLISCKVTDYTFISEEQLSFIFAALSELDIRINVLQNSAISFSFCVDYRESKIKKLIERLQKNFEVYYNLGLTLITVKNYDAKTFDTYRHRPGVLLEQSSRSTLQVLVRN